MSEWQTIDTAPRDGTRVLLFRRVTPRSHGLVVGFYSRPMSAWQLSPGNYGCNPTHWMPLPEAPR